MLPKVRRDQLGVYSGRGVRLAGGGVTMTEDAVARNSGLPTSAEDLLSIRARHSRT